MNFEKEQGKFEKLEETNVKLLGQLTSYEKELFQYHTTSRIEKSNVNTQTIDLDPPQERCFHDFYFFLFSYCKDHLDQFTSVFFCFRFSSFNQSKISNVWCDIFLHRLKKSRSTDGNGKKFGWKIFTGNKDGNKTPKKEDKNNLKFSLDEGELRKMKQSKNTQDINRRSLALDEDNENRESGSEQEEQTKDLSHQQTLTSQHHSGQEHPFIVLSQVVLILIILLNMNE